jgi:hypothetical protein
MIRGVEDEPKPQRWGYDEDGMLLRVGHTQDDDYLRNRGEDYGVIYDRRGRINRVLYPGENNQPVMEVEYKYNDADQVTAIIARDLTKGAATDIYCMQYDYDTNGRKVRQVIKPCENAPDTMAYYVTTFNYDSRDILTEEKYIRYDMENNQWKVMYWARYKYDTAGNMVRRDVDQIVNGDLKQYSDGFAYSRGYQLIGILREAVGYDITISLEYDDNGNMTHIEPQAQFPDAFYDITEMEFQYDLKNRLIKYRFGGSGDWSEIKYDALGRVRERLSADETPITNKFYYDGRQLIQQLNDSNDAEFDYLRGPTGLDRQWNESNDTRRFYIKDNLGTVWAIVNPSDLSVKRYNYNAWGEHLDKDDTDFPTDTNWMRYIGCRVEAFGKGSTTQRDVICHTDFRHYLPAICSFAQRDPSVKSTADNYFVYKYANNIPSVLSDPYGLQPYGDIKKCLERMQNVLDTYNNCIKPAMDKRDQEVKAAIKEKEHWEKYIDVVVPNRLWAARELCHLRLIACCAASFGSLYWIECWIEYYGCLQRANEWRDKIYASAYCKEENAIRRMANARIMFQYDTCICRRQACKDFNDMWKDCFKLLEFFSYGLPDCKYGKVTLNDLGEVCVDDIRDFCATYAENCEHYKSNLIGYKTCPEDPGAFNP